ncbi:hypothetical protein [Streptomyces radiopugnans]|uniref:hypothetical protein n=1 Tax=Streptomyces radiopugnans TaxID=403935 RepID=UPI003F1DC524
MVSATSGRPGAVACAVGAESLPVTGVYPPWCTVTRHGLRSSPTVMCAMAYAPGRAESRTPVRIEPPGLSCRSQVSGSAGVGTVEAGGGDAFGGAVDRIAAIGHR